MLTATEGVTTFGTALGTERLGFKPRAEFGIRRAFADGNDISTRTGAMPFTDPAVVPTAVFNPGGYFVSGSPGAGGLGFAPPGASAATVIPPQVIPVARTNTAIIRSNLIMSP